MMPAHPLIKAVALTPFRNFRLEVGDKYGVVMNASGMRIFPKILVT
jgi:hypothetical protein